MIALKVSINGSHPCTAGAVDMGVLTVGVSAIGLLGPDSKMRRDDETVDIHLHVGGLTARKDKADDHLNWSNGVNLEIGDRIEVEICDVEEVDAPESTHPKDEQRAEAQLKEKFEYAREFYFQFRDRFESSNDAAS